MADTTITLLKTYILTLAISSVILVVLYLIAAVRSFTGKTYKKIVLIEAMLLVSNIAYFFEAYGQWKMNFGTTENSDFWITTADLGTAIGDFLFSEAHWMFAFYYMRIAQNMPRIIK